MKKAIIYKDGACEIRWRLKARNGRTLADSGEGYNREADCLAGLAELQASAVGLFERMIEVKP